MARKKDRRQGLEVARLTAERAMSDVHRLLEEREFTSEDEINEFLRRLTGPGLEQALAGREEKDPKKKAQNLAYDAMEAETTKKALQLARQALELDPDCVDARLVAAELTCRSEKEYLAQVQAAVEAGERTLGAEFFRENKGHFWGILETRPYMRARHQFAQLLAASGRLADAAAHFEALLELNPNDNQGVRDELLCLYLLGRELEAGERLLSRYREEGSAVFLWGRVLHAFLSGREKTAQLELKQARKGNRYVEDFLTGEKPLPRQLPEMYGFGDESEAVYCAFLQMPAWLVHPEAIAWLQSMPRRR
jgi:tetratricopeptide (TPR) repeat protein